jgi:uncharacterized repeat protein (TIGR03803 family)
MLVRPTFAGLLSLFFGLSIALAASAAAANAKLNVLFRFAGGTSGANPVGPLISDAAGNLYGVTQTGGVAKVGLIFELSPPAKKGGRWTETVLYSFTGKADGGYPAAGLAFDRAGNVYGTTYYGGNCAYDCGVVFELTRAKASSWRYSVIHAFAGVGTGGGGQPVGSPVVDSAGNLYGTTYYGGYKTCTNFPGPCGMVYRLAPPASKGGTWVETVLYSFSGVPDGQFPGKGVTLDLNGNVFGTTSEGGTGRCTDGSGLTIGCGTLFELSPASGGGWSEAVLHDFNVTQNGPSTVLQLEADGSLIGAANYHLFQLSPPKSPGGTWNERVLYVFPEGIAGTIPGSALVPDGKGNLFGTTVTSGLSGYGTVYELSPPAKADSPWTVTTLQTFSGGLNSEQPLGGVIFGTDGALYGAASNTAANRGGFVFRLTP